MWPGLLLSAPDQRKRSNAVGQHASNVIHRIVQQGEGDTAGKVQTSRYDSMSLEFRQGATRDREKLDQLTSMPSCGPFSYVRSYGNCRSSDLAAVRNAVRNGELLNGMMGQNGEIHSAVPHSEFPVVFH
jgi:DNA polymerase/3'-5' exonuclease PolX